MHLHHTKINQQVNTQSGCSDHTYYSGNEIVERYFGIYRVLAVRKGKGNRDNCLRLVEQSGRVPVVVMGRGRFAIEVALGAVTIL